MTTNMPADNTDTCAGSAVAVAAVVKGLQAGVHVDVPGPQRQLVVGSSNSGACGQLGIFAARVMVRAGRQPCQKPPCNRMSSHGLPPPRHTHTRHTHTT